MGKYFHFDENVETIGAYVQRIMEITKRIHTKEKLGRHVAEQSRGARAFLTMK